MPSLSLAMGHDEAVKAYEQNISALAIAAQFINGDGAGAGQNRQRSPSNIFAVMTAFFGGTSRLSRKTTQGIVMNILRPQNAGRKINEAPSSAGLCCLPSCWPGPPDCIKRAGIELHLHLQPIFGMVGCLILHGWSTKSA